MAKKVMTAPQAAKQARKGVDQGASGKGFAKIVDKTKGKYGEAAARRIAGSIYQKKRKAGTL